MRSVFSLLLAVSACTHITAESYSARSETLQVGHALVELRFAGDDTNAAEQVKRVLPRALMASERWGPLDVPVVLTIHGSHEALEAVSHREAPWMRAWARSNTVDLQSPRTWSRGRVTDDALGQILAHEFTHCVLFNVAGPGWPDRRIPAWFQEGMASVTAGELHENARIASLGTSTPLATTNAKLFYDNADAAFRFLVAEYGEDQVHLLLASLAEGRAFPVVFREVIGLTLDDFEGAFYSRLAFGAFEGIPN